jgi:hypothetical protein
LRRHRLRRALIGERAFDDRPIDPPRSALGRRFALRRRWRRNVFVTPIDDRFEGIELRRRLVVAPIATATAIAAFAERLAALAAPRSTIAIAPLTVARLAFTALASSLTVASLTIAGLTVARLATRALTFSPLIAALTALAIAIAARATPTRATLATLLLLFSALSRLSRSALATRSRCPLGPRATAAATPATRTIASRESRQTEFATSGNRLDTHATRRCGRLFTFARCCFACCRCGFIRARGVRRCAFRLRPWTTAATPATAALLRIARQMQRALLRCVRRFWRRAGSARASVFAYRRSRLRRGWCLWLRRGRGRARIFIIPDHGAET